MNEEQQLDISIFINLVSKLSLLTSRKNLTVSEARSLIFCQRFCNLKMLQRLDSLSAPWRFYTVWYKGPVPTRVNTPYYFQVNLAKMQPFYTTMHAGRQVHKTFSTGCILRLYRIISKRDRRKVDKAPLSLRFFKRFLYKYIAYSHTTAVCLGYRRRYSFFLSSALLPFMRQYAFALSFSPQTLTSAFSFRRVKAIKKRIRKRLSFRIK